ncbi:potassium voltage-gated channel subfamily D member 3 isoform X1 [Hydra vulgaris]|uniref:Potassium voltage-gated channel subfamily D member 3 isoform X1 n=1 Tax=Hydra vulgaris TaxID=6087 RepID=A0ABM4CGM2_HYDVU
MHSPCTTARYIAKKKASIRSCILNENKKQLLVDPIAYIVGNELTINVSGAKFRLHESYMKQHPETLLGSDERLFYFDEEENEFFFDRDPHIFRFIYKFYKTGELHFSPNDCYEAFTDELLFFRIPTTELAFCCGDYYFQYKSVQKKDEVNKIDTNQNKPKTFREKCWLFCEVPTYSIPAKAFYIVSCLVIVFTMITMSAETVQCEKMLNNTVVQDKCGAVFTQLFFKLDSFCVSFFILEYLLRVYSAPNRLSYIKSPISFIDVLAIAPFFILLVQSYINIKNKTANNILAALPSIRIVRVFKLARYSQQLRQLIAALVHSIKELGFIVFVYCVVVVLFATIIYYAENFRRQSKVFYSIPEAMWFTVVTTTTLGYGDVVPETIQGRLIGALCCLMGVLVIALPVPIIQMKANSIDEESE